MSERGGKRRPAVRDLDDLLADAVDRALVALESGGLAVRRLDPVAVELLVGRDRARGEVERRGAGLRLNLTDAGDCA